MSKFDFKKVLTSEEREQCLVYKDDMVAVSDGNGPWWMDVKGTELELAIEISDNADCWSYSKQTNLAARMTCWSTQSRTRAIMQMGRERYEYIIMAKRALAFMSRKMVS